MYASQEPLETMKIGFAFSRYKFLTMPRSRIVPPGRNLRRIGGDVLDLQDGETGVT